MIRRHIATIYTPQGRALVPSATRRFRSRASALRWVERVLTRHGCTATRANYWRAFQHMPSGEVRDTRTGHWETFDPPVRFVPSVGELGYG